MTGDGAWDLVVARNDLGQTLIRERPVPEPGTGEVLLRVDRVGITNNNVTYARLGETLRYWDFFPTEEGWGRVPLWGFADVEASNVEGIKPGDRYYGYLPTSSHLVVKPGPANAGFRDVSDHRSELPGVYNVYLSIADDPGYRAEHEDLQILYRPLFITSFMLDDFLDDSGLEADTILMSSASSKTAYGTAFCIGMRGERPHLIGLTSPSNISFTQSLGCYDDVVAYDDIATVAPDTKAIYVDVSGNPKLRRKIHEYFDNLVYDCAVGITHDDATFDLGAELPGPKTQFFFAPDQIRKRRQDWGPGGIEVRYAKAWNAFAPEAEKWVDVKVGHGSEALVEVWTEVLGGRVDPRIGHVISLA